MTGAAFFFFSIITSYVIKALGLASLKSNAARWEPASAHDFQTGFVFEAEAKNAVAKLLLALNPPSDSTRRSHIVRLVSATTVASLPAVFSSPASAALIDDPRVQDLIGSITAGSKEEDKFEAQWCGEAIPTEVDTQYSYGTINSSLRYRVVGELARDLKSNAPPVLDVPPVLVVGAPGLGYEYLENFEALTLANRSVIEIIKFAKANEATTVDAVAEQLSKVCRSLNVPTVNVIAHGAGAAAALRLANGGNGVTVRSLILVSPYRGVNDLRAGVSLPPIAKIELGDIEFLASALLPSGSKKALKSCIAATTGRISVSDGIFFTKLLASKERFGSEGTLGELLTKLGVPVLLASGGTSELIDVNGWSGLPTSVKRVTFTSSGHLPFIDEREKFLLTANQFLDKVDGKESIASNPEAGLFRTVQPSQ